MAITINGINHFGISVKDMDESVAWYERVFGFTVLDMSVIPEVDGTYGIYINDNTSNLIEIFEEGS